MCGLHYRGGCVLGLKKSCCSMYSFHLLNSAFGGPRNFKIMKMLRHFRLSGFVARGVRFKIS